MRRGTESVILRHVLSDDDALAWMMMMTALASTTSTYMQNALSTKRNSRLAVHLFTRIVHCRTSIYAGKLRQSMNEPHRQLLEQEVDGVLQHPVLTSKY